MTKIFGCRFCRIDEKWRHAIHELLFINLRSPEAAQWEGRGGIVRSEIRNPTRSPDGADRCIFLSSRVLWRLRPMKRPSMVALGAQERRRLKKREEVFVFRNPAHVSRRFREKHAHKAPSNELRRKHEGEHLHSVRRVYAHSLADLGVSRHQILKLLGAASRQHLLL